MCAAHDDNDQKPKMPMSRKIRYLADTKGLHHSWQKSAHPLWPFTLYP